MKCIIKFLCPIVALVILQSCEKKGLEDEVIIDYYNYATKFDWREDSVKTGSGDWAKIEKGTLFTLLSEDLTLGKALQRPGGFAIYINRNNLRAEFIYSISKDSIFTFSLSKDSIYFPDQSGRYRTDLKGQLSFSPDTSLILRNTAISPEISIKYRLEK